MIFSTTPTFARGLLISTFRIQHQIEIYFEDNGLFYDRRKGHYKSLRKPARQIVSILDLMQAVIAIMLRKPDDARARPRDYLKENKRPLIFGADDQDGTDTHQPYPVDIYLRCVQIVRKIDGYLAKSGVDSNTALNTRFYVALEATASAANNARFHIAEIRAIDVERGFTESFMEESFKRVMRIYKAKGGDDEAAKGKSMAAALIKSLGQRYSPPRKGRKTKR